MKVFISTTTFAKYDNKPLDMLKEKGYEVNLNSFKRKMTKDESMSLGPDVDALLAGTEKLDEDVFKKLKNLKVISRCGSGLDSVDLNTAEKFGIKVFNTPDVTTAPVSELTLGLMLSILRKISLADRKMHRGVWEKEMGNLLKNKKVGIIGFGRVGKRVSHYLRSFDAEIYFYDPIQKDDLEGAKSLQLNELLKIVDIVTLHVPFSDKNKNMIGKKELSLMKKGSMLINCSRGGVINEKELMNALESKHLSGAAIDVFEIEPYKGPLSNLDNVILTPHIGSYAVEARIQMEVEAVENLIKGLES